MHVISFSCKIKVIFIRMVSYLDSLWKRGTRELGNGLFNIRTGTFGLGGGGGWWPYCPKKITQCPKECVMQTHSNHSKTKTLPILTSNERIIIPKLQLNPKFSNLRGERKLVRKIGYFEKSGVTKITVSEEGEGNDFCLELSGGSKKWGFKSSVFNCSYFSWNLAYNLTSIDWSKTCQKNSKFFLVGKVQENFETVLCGAIENGSLQNHHKKVYSPGQKCWGISMQFSISLHATILSKRNKFASLSTPDAMLF